MFDMGFSELLVIGAVALVVIGPERLPGVARAAGHMLGRMRRYLDEVKAEIDREATLGDLKKLHGEIMDSARGLERDMRVGMRQMESRLTLDAEPKDAPAKGDETAANP